jgi:hypothetical protein
MNLTLNLKFFKCIFYHILEHVNPYDVKLLLQLDFKHFKNCQYKGRHSLMSLLWLGQE